MSDPTPHDDHPTPPPPPAATQGTPPPPPVASPPPAQQAAYPPPSTGSTSYRAPAGASPLSPTEEKTWGMLSHVIGGLAMVFSAGFLGFVASLVIYVMYKDRGPFVRAHAANSLNVQITAAIGSVVGWILTITVIGAIVGIPILIAVFVWAVVVHIIGALKANNGEWWEPPLAPKFVR